MILWLALTSKFGHHRLFWRLRSAWEQLRFGALRRWFLFRRFSDRSREDASIFRQLVLGPAFFAILVLGVVYALHELTNSLWPRLLGWVGRSTSLTLPALSLDDDIYDILLTTIAGVTGVFLGLYFTTMSTIAATVYVTVPHDVRSMMLRDQVSLLYVRILSFLTFFSLVLLCGRVVGGPPITTALPVLLLLAAVAIFSFGRLGERLFYFADPTQLTGVLVHRLAKLTRACTYNGTLWSEPAFQNHYRKLCANHIRALEALLQLSRTHKHLRGQPQSTLTSRMSAFLGNYSSLKSRIPSGSRWFGQRYRHKQWFLASSTEVSMASQNHTALSPEIVPDRLWIEKALLDPLTQALADDFRAGNYSAAVETITQLGGAFEAMASTMELEPLHKQIVKVTSALLASPSPQVHELRVVAQRLAAVEGLALLTISVELGFYKTATTWRRETLERCVSRDSWRSPSAPLRLHLPPTVLPELERLQAGIAFEIRAEGNRLTPNWYILDIVVHQLTWQVYHRLGECLTHFERWFVPTTKQLLEAKDYRGAAALLSRGLEACWKLASHLPDLRTTVEELDEKNVLNDLHRPEFAWDSYLSRVDALREQLIGMVAATVPALSIQPPTEDLPDYFGQAVHRTAETCFESLLQPKPDSYAVLFPPFFYGVLSAFDRMKKELSDIRPETAVHWLAEPIIDLLTISGMALISSELHQEARVWDTCTTTWDKYLETTGADQTMRAFAAGRAIQRSTFAISPRALVRSEWNTRLGRVLGAVPRKSPTHPYHDGELDHPSRLIRRLGYSAILLPTFDAADLFVARYLLKHELGKDLDFGVRRHYLRDLGYSEEDEDGADDAG